MLNELRSLPPALRISRLQREQAPSAVLLDLAEAASRLTTGDSSTAIEAADIVCGLADHFGHPLAQARARRARGRALCYAGRFDEALLVCEEAAAIAERGGHGAESARARLASMHALTESGRLDTAIQVGRHARDTLRELDEPALAARAEINLGIAYQRRDDPARAVQCFDRARMPLRAEPLMLGHLDNSRGEALLALNDFQGAESAFGAALRAFEEARAPITAAIAEGNLADLAARQGQIHRALYHFERARRRFEVDRSPAHLARLLAEQAEAKAALGLPEEALAEFEAVLGELDVGGLALEAARARSGMGSVLLRLGRHTEAETALAAAATAFDELGHQTARARVDLLRAELLMLNHRFEEAAEMGLRSLSQLARRPADALTARHLLARLALQSGQLSAAESELNAAIDLARGLEVAPVLADLLCSRGTLHLKLSSFERAVQDLSAAVDAVERLRGTLQAERLRAAYLGNRLEVYERLVEALLAWGTSESLASAFAVTEKAKSRALLDLISPVTTTTEPTTVEREPAEAAVAALQARLARLQSDLNGLYSRLADVDASGRAPCGVELLHETIRQREDELEQVRGRLSITSGAAGLMAPTITLEEAQQAIEPGSALIEYMSRGEELLAFVVQRDRVRVHRRLATIPQLATTLSRLRFQVNRALRRADVSRPDMVEDARAELGRLYEQLLRPFAEDLPRGRLTIVPHGPLHLVPFHALWDGDRHLLETHRIHYAPSASILAQLEAVGHGPPGTPVDPALSAAPVVVGVADEVAPRIASEAEAVARVLQCDPERILLGAEATVDAVVDGARRSSLLHLACHGRFSADAPLTSGLRLADRWLTVRDIYALKIDAQLVTLSGCETGVNAVRAGDELQGLLRGFFAAGARTLLVSQWRAHDESTAWFMQRFYELRAGPSPPEEKAETVRQVQLELRQRWPHPAHWAPFVLVGRP